MILISVFSVIGGAALGLSSRAAAFVLRMVAFSIALSAAANLAQGWSLGGFLGGCLLASIGCQIGYLCIVLVRTALVPHEGSAVAKSRMKRAG